MRGKGDKGGRCEWRCMPGGMSWACAGCRALNMEILGMSLDMGALDKMAKRNGLGEETGALIREREEVNGIRDEDEDEMMEQFVHPSTETSLHPNFRL